MKNSLFFLLLLISTSFLSCEKEKIDPSLLSRMSIYGTEIPIRSGVIWKSTQNTILEKTEYVWEDIYTDKEGIKHSDNVVGFFRSDNKIETGNFMLSLYGDGLNFLPDLATTKGEGAIICLHLASSDLKQLVAGKYKFSDNKLANTFIGYLSSSYNMAGISKNIATISDGEVTVVNEGENLYSVDVNVKLASGIQVTCNYKGSLVNCSVEQPKMANMQGIALHGLLPIVEKRTWQDPNIFGGTGELVYSYVNDEINKAFLSTASGGTQTSAQEKTSVEIAVALDLTAEEFTFLSPIKARSILGHLDQYNFACHTIFMKAPASFTDSDYDNLETSGINFTVTEEVVKFPLKNLTPGYVFFDAGNGIKGVVKVKGVGAPFEIAEDMFAGMGWWLDYSTTSEQLLCDVKAITNYGNPKIR